VTGRHVVVIGGGLAGVSAAVALRDAGTDVTLLESKPWLGGAAASFARGPLQVDTGQHVFLRCCEAYQGLLARLGVTGSVTIQPRFDVTVLGADGRARLRRSSLPSPLHLTAALARYRLLTVAERARVGRAALAFSRADPTAGALDGTRLGDFLAAAGQNERTRRLLWDLFIVASLNIAGDDADVPLAATVIKTALLGRNDAADIGIATVPLADIHGKATSRLLAELRARVRFGARVASVERRPGSGFSVLLAADRDSGAGLTRGEAPRTPLGPTRGEAPSTPLGGAQVVEADAVVLAVPPGQAARLGAAAGVSYAGAWEGLGSSPIVNVHVVYDRPVLELPFAAAVDSPVQWVFDKTRQAGLASGQYLAVSVSAADSYVDQPAAALRAVFLPALARLLPAAASADVQDFFVTRERRATFRQAPGCGALRPGAATSVPGLVLAGSWTDTGWPDTMEGAVRSGHNAARELISQLAAQSSPGGRPPGPPSTSPGGTTPRYPPAEVGAS
jgi:squalene-associated FAD-dependent desaturase